MSVALGFAARQRQVHVQTAAPRASAADKGFSRSRVLLGMAFANGYLVPRDQAEAYKWLKLAPTGGFMTDIAAGPVRDRLLKETPLASIQEGERRAINYWPGFTLIQIRSQLVLPLLKLTGLATMNGKRIALIGGKKLSENEDTRVELGGLSITLRAISISEKQVVICLPPNPQQYVLRP